MPINVLIVVLVILVTIYIAVTKYRKILKKNNLHISDLCFERFTIGYTKDKVDLQMMAFHDMQRYCPYHGKYKCAFGECLVCESDMGWKQKFINKYGKEKFDAATKKSSDQILSARYPDGQSE